MNLRDPGNGAKSPVTRLLLLHSSAEVVEDPSEPHLLSFAEICNGKRWSSVTSCRLKLRAKTLIGVRPAQANCFRPNRNFATSARLQSACEEAKSKLIQQFHARTLHATCLVQPRCGRDKPERAIFSGRVGDPSHALVRRGSGESGFKVLATDRANTKSIRTMLTSDAEGPQQAQDLNSGIGPDLAELGVAAAVPG